MAEKITYFQYYKENEYPLAVSVDLTDHHKEFFNSLELLGFTEISSEDWSEGKDKGHYCVEVQLPAPMVAHTLSRGDNFAGLESLVSKNGFKTYKYKNCCQMDFSPRIKTWRLYLLNDATNERNEYMHILNRIISWALEGEQVIGFWGVPVEDGLIGMQASESLSEAFFIDLKQQRLLSVDGNLALPSRLKILRLDSTLKGKSRGMAPEELYSFLSHRSTYLDVLGSSKNVKQALRYLVSYAKGYIWPRDNFTPRTDLSMSKPSDKVF